MTNREKVLRKQASHEVLRVLYRSVRGIDISNASKEKSGSSSDKSLTYGEITTQSFEQLLKDSLATLGKSKGSSGLQFVDLGSGTGKACLTAALACTEFSRVWGIELMPELHEVALQARTRLTKALELSLKAAKKAKNTMGASLLKLGQLDRVEKLGRAEKKPKTKIKQEKVYEESELVEYLKEMLISSNKSDTAGDDGSIDSDSAITNSDKESLLANKMVVKLGHKCFKASFKPHKSFHNFLEKRPTLFSFEGGGDMVRFVGAGIGDGCDSSNDNDDDKDKEEKEEKEGKEVESADSAVAPGEDSDREDRSVEQLNRVLSGQGVTQALAHTRGVDVKLEAGDIFDCSWWDNTDVCYCASLLFSDGMMERLHEQVLLMPTGAVFLTLKPLPLRLQKEEEENEVDNKGEKEKSARLVSESFYQMSWHLAKVYMYTIVEA